MRKQLITASVVCAAVASIIGFGAFANSGSDDQIISNSVEASDAAQIPQTEITAAAVAATQQADLPADVIVEEEEQEPVAAYGSVSAPIKGCDADFNDTTNLEEYGFSGWYRISAEKGTDVYSVMDGTVEYAGWWHGYGNIVSILHTDGTYSFYSHLDELMVADGDIVKGGQLIGTVGSTGSAWVPNLDYARSSSSICSTWWDLPDIVAYDPLDLYAKPNGVSSDDGFITDADGNVIEEE